MSCIYFCLYLLLMLAIFKNYKLIFGINTIYYLNITNNIYVFGYIDISNINKIIIF